MDTLLDASHGHKLEALFTLEMTTGLRINELLALKWADADLTVGFIRVTRNRSRRVKGYADTKTESGRRPVRLTSNAIDALRAHRERQDEERLGLGDAWQDLGYIFASSIGTALDDSNVHKQYYALIKGAGLPRIVFHDLRHSAVSWLIAHSVPVLRLSVSEMLGHADSSITMRIYAHAMPDGQEQAVAVMERLLKRRRQ